MLTAFGGSGGDLCDKNIYRHGPDVRFKIETQHQNIYLKGIMYEHSFYKKDNLSPYCLLYGLLHDCLQFRQQFTV